MAGIVIERNVPCTARDGVELATDVFRPDDGRRHPVLLQRTPYDKGFHPFTWAVAVLAPALQIAGWYDALLAGDLSHFVSMRREAGSPEARSRTRLVVGPWSHATFTSSVGELDFGCAPPGSRSICART